MSCANIVLPVFMIRPSSADARARPTGNQIRPSNDLRKTISDQYFIDNLASANRTAVSFFQKRSASFLPLNAPSPHPPAPPPPPRSAHAATTAARKPARSSPPSATAPDRPPPSPPPR